MAKSNFRYLLYSFWDEKLIFSHLIFTSFLFWNCSTILKQPRRRRSSNKKKPTVERIEKWWMNLIEVGKDKKKNLKLNIDVSNFLYFFFATPKFNLSPVLRLQRSAEEYWVTHQDVITRDILQVKSHSFKKKISPEWQPPPLPSSASNFHLVITAANLSFCCKIKKKVK